MRRWWPENATGGIGGRDAAGRVGASHGPVALPLSCPIPQRLPRCAIQAAHGGFPVVLEGRQTAGGGDQTWSPPPVTFSPGFTPFGQAGNWETDGKRTMQIAARCCAKTRRTARTCMLPCRSEGVHPSDLQQLRPARCSNGSPDLPTISQKHFPGTTSANTGRNAALKRSSLMPHNCPPRPHRWTVVLVASFLTVPAAGKDATPGHARRRTERRTPLPRHHFRNCAIMGTMRSSSAFTLVTTDDALITDR